jgi:putative hydrolase of the HAD superfamily
MLDGSKEYIKKLLDNQETILPIPTGVKSRFKPDPKIKAILLDIYGTLLISSSGDIDQTEMSNVNLKQALDAAGIRTHPDIENVTDNILADFQYTIRVCHEASRYNNIPFPEIDILSIWKIVLIHARRKGLVTYDDDADILLLTCVFEFLSNKVSPMPKLKETIETLQDKNIPVGIVSNAQFYTPVLMNYFLNNKISLNDRVLGFDRELTVLSYKFGKAKPDHSLYEELIPTLKWKYGIGPSEVLFVGNDMLNDIYASRQAGFKTGLFAGDKRSLRMRSSDQRLSACEPDFIIDRLDQLLTIVA